MNPNSILIQHMKAKMRSSVSGFAMALILMGVMYCEGCWNIEREALLALNAQFHMPLSWVDGTDCCQWERVDCNSTTRRVTKLDLSVVAFKYWHPNYTHFLVFEDLKSLKLGSNGITYCLQNEGMRLNNLEVLDLGDNSLNTSTAILSCVDGFSSLKSLSLASNWFEATSSTSLHAAFQTLSSNLLGLEVLDVSGNNLSNDVLSALGGFKLLKNLSLSATGLISDSTLYIQGLFSKLINLEVLDMSWNNFSGKNDIAASLSGLSSLKSLDLRVNQMTLLSILSISKLSSLEILSLSGNSFSDNHLWYLEKEGFEWPINLQFLVLGSCGLSNNFISLLSGLQHLKSLDLSSNQLAGSLNITGVLGSSNLKILDLSNNNINSLVHQGSRILNLEVLSLDSNKIYGSMLRKSLTAFESVRELSLTNNQFKEIVVAADFRDLSNLERLFLNDSTLVNEFFKSIGVLTSIRVLSITGCGIKGTLPDAGFFELRRMEELDLSYNEMQGPLPPSFANMSSLRRLDLSYNHFTGNFGSNLASLTSLEYLNFERNQFEFPISFTPFANYSNLKFIYGDGNKAILDSHTTLNSFLPKFQLQVLSLSSKTEAKSLPFPNFLLYQYNLTYLDLSGTRLGGEFPNWLLENNTKLTDLLLGSCSFTGSFKLPSSPLVSLRKIDVSDNAIAGQIPSNNISSIFPNLTFLNMSMNDIHGSIPHEFGRMSSLVTLDLSDNYLSGELLKNVSAASSMLSLLKLSNNHLGGAVFPTLSRLRQMVNLYLDGNSFTGSISFNISISLEVMDISNNHFVGELPSRGIAKLLSLKALSMSNNHLEGSIPPEIAQLISLTYLDLSQNNFTGSVPSFVESPVTLSFIHLSSNKLSELPKRMFKEGSSILMLDLSYNQITKSIGDLIQDLTSSQLSILLLNDNHFGGQIPKQICHLMDLSILDLSHNNFFGSIPSCLGKMPFQNQDPEHLLNILNGIFPSRGVFVLPFVQERANFTTKKRSYIYTGIVLAYMSGIDLSDNRLNGTIPSELGNLTTIRALNLSHNDLRGKIPTTFSSLAQIESLDLSFNNLGGNIPPQLTELSSLAVFSVAHNNLSGSTPEMKGQFSTFDDSSYEGNPFLCGPPLPRSCNPNAKPYEKLPNGTDTDEDNGNWLDMLDFWVSFCIAYTTILLVIVTVLCINPYWRRVWFYYIEFVSINGYYFIEDNFRSLLRAGNM
ncbi:hypothetical protein HN51_066454 [Arachis hypogaea]|uniref:Leucine-rich repeat-containing N-terminal plant-type domain-containing protein n=1 Tax=Arachis hypogaea TaxID=3818 RepID=A0A444ZP33_ARAHY|nr:LRR receptor-like serine/threonine-protein kinase FLS2 isoform X1 [Arachis ipaensis]XP_025648633.1 receptor like protein 21 isoform X1 [Arachis hypogaea]QHO07763.1 LRR receptor-like serine/threonine-protein kinase [Arachis hypogaea]RYR15872.1 hypothetical protein Ahy_B04g072806 [Arachis hypogaea]